MTEEAIEKSAFRQEFGRSVAATTESPIDILIQSMMITDTELLNITKGKILEPLNVLQEMIVVFDKNQRIEHEDATQILNAIDLLNQRVQGFQKLLPYQILLGHLMRLTNISQKQADQLMQEVNLMIEYDLCDIDEDKLELTDINFFRALKILCHNAIQDSVEGFKIKAITEQRRKISAEFTSTEHKKKKGLLGRFF